MPADSSLPEPETAGAISDWAATSRRGRVIAVVLAIAIAVLTFAVVNRVWRRAAPAPPAPAGAVEVKLVPSAPPSSPR